MEEDLLWRALDLVSLTDEVKGFPDGLETKISAIHTNVSGGQLQRLVIARAGLRNRPALLLDEATASLDAAVESTILAALIAENRERGGFLLAITHRLEQLARFDRVAFLDDGRIAFCGSWDELQQWKPFASFFRGAHG